MKANIMKATNQLIEALLFCDDDGLVDAVVDCIVSGTPFGDDEIEMAEEEDD